MKIKKLEYENDAASGQMRFLYANLTEERKAMIRTAYGNQDFILTKLPLLLVPLYIVKRQVKSM